MTENPRIDLVNRYSEALRLMAEAEKQRKVGSDAYVEVIELLQKALQPDEVWVYEGLAYLKSATGQHIERRKVIDLDA